MDLGAAHQTVQRWAFVAAALLVLVGVAALQVVGDTPGAAPPDYVRKVNAADPARAATFPTTTSGVARRRPRTTTTWFNAAVEPVAAEPAAPAKPVEPPPAAQPDAQLDVAVPALGAQASAGQGDGSCTTVRVTALTPDGCPEPSGEGPVIVHYHGDGVGNDRGRFV